MRLANHLRLLNAKAGLFAKRDPFPLGIDAAMSRVAKRFDLVLERGTLRVLGRERIDEDEDTAGPHHPGDLAHREGYVIEMMRGKAGGHDIEARIGERQSLRRGRHEFRISNAGVPKDFTGGGQHGVNRIGEHNAGDLRRQGEGRVASPGTDVEDAFGAGGRRKIDNKLELVPGPVFAGGVSLRGLLPAARGACHRLSLRRRCRAPA